MFGLLLQSVNQHSVFAEFSKLRLKIADKLQLAVVQDSLQVVISLYVVIILKLTPDSQNQLEIPLSLVNVFQKTIDGLFAYGQLIEHIHQYGIFGFEVVVKLFLIHDKSTYISMGICPNFSKRTPDQDSISSALKSSIPDPEQHLTVRLQTTNDSQFLYFTRFWDMQHVLNTILDDKKLLRESEHLVKDYLADLKAYIKEVENADSRLVRDLTKAYNNAQGKGYVCLEIQSILLREKAREIDIELICQAKSIQTVLDKATMKTLHRNRIFDINRCWKLSVDPTGFLVIRINKLKSTTILLKQVNQSLAVAEVVNLRREGMLDAVGEISIRVECVRDVNDWKLKTSRMLKMREKQLEKLLEECKKVEPGVLGGQKVFIRSSLSERPTSKNFSYYEPSIFETQVRQIN